MQVMRRSDFKRQLQAGLNTVFGMEYKRHPEQWRQVYDVTDTNKAYEEDVLMAGLGAAQVKPEGSGVAYDAGAELWTAKHVMETIALAFAITEEAIEDGLYGNLGAKYSRALARSMQHTKELKGASLLNNAFSSNHAIGDGRPMIDASHPLYYGGVMSNTLATPADIAEASLEDLINVIAMIKDDRGIPMSLTALKLIAHPTQQFVLERLLKTTGRPGTADNDVNAIKNMGLLPQGVGYMHRLTDPNAWFIKTDASDGLKYWRRKALQRGVEGDFDTGNLRYKARERYRFSITDPRAIFGSSGNGN